MRRITTSATCNELLIAGWADSSSSTTCVLLNTHLTFSLTLIVSEALTVVADEIQQVLYHMTNYTTWLDSFPVCSYEALNRKRARH